MGKREIITSHRVTCRRGDIFYRACGPEDGPVILFLHGWPELSISWRHQLPVFGMLGFRAIAVDLPGFGQSTAHKGPSAHSLENLVGDLLSFLDAVGRENAVWVGHDIGSPLAWSVASHHPDRCLAVASLCVPYRTLECGLDALVSTVDRSIYPESDYPLGQWDYMKFFEESFDEAITPFEADPANFFKNMFRRSDPSAAGKPRITASVRNRGGWFGDRAVPPEAEMDPAIIDDDSLAVYVAEFSRTGFEGPTSHYLNHEANAQYTKRSLNGGRLDMPALFLLAEHDHHCECIISNFADEMRQHCSNLAAVAIPGGHWLAQEAPAAVNSALAHWLSHHSLWPAQRRPKWRPLCES